MKTVLHLKAICLVSALCCAMSLTSSAQTLQTLMNLVPGDRFLGELTQGRNGNMFSVSPYGGAQQYGAILEFSGQNGADLYNFCVASKCPDGQAPSQGVVLGSDGYFYGTTYSGGLGGGTVYKISPSGSHTILYEFCTQAKCTDGEWPQGTVTQAADGNLYGTTTSGGRPYLAGYGTLFKVTPTGQFTLLYTFCVKANCADGSNPSIPPIQASDGRLYGTTQYGGSHNVGTVYTLESTGKINVLYSFVPHPGDTATSNPANLLQASDGNLYGTTSLGGAADEGTVFKISPTTGFSTIYQFCSESNCTDGAGPTSLLQGPDGNFYGMTNGGQTANNSGTIFKLTPDGTLTTLYNFCQQSGCPDGSDPMYLSLATDGNLYGATGWGGAVGDGTLFSFSVGFSPFVQPNPVAGRAGSAIGILGNQLSGATSVTFNGAPASFTVVSDTFINATIPSGATTGPIQVTTLSGTLSSIVNFQVR